MKPDKEVLMIFALVVGLAGAFFFGIPAFGQYYDFTNQGGPNPAASELPAVPIPSMSLSELLKVLIPSCIGIMASGLYILSAFIYFFRRIVILKFMYVIAGLDILARLLMPLVTPILKPLPTVSQNMLASIFSTGPFVLCGIYSFSLFFLLKKAE